MDAENKNDPSIENYYAQRHPTMKFASHFAIAALHFFAVAFAHYCAGVVVDGVYSSRATTTGGGTIGPIIGVGGREELVCPLDYAHPEIYNGSSFPRGAVEEGLVSQPTIQALMLRASSPPIEIVRQAGAFVEFKVRNSPFFSAAAAAVASSSATGFVGDLPDSSTERPSSNNAPLARRVFAVFHNDAFMSSRCKEYSGEAAFSSSSTTIPAAYSFSSELLKAYCPPTGKNALVSLYVQFENDDEAFCSADGRDEGGRKCLGILSSCLCSSSGNNTSRSDDSNSSSPSTTAKLVEFAFNLICLPTCDDPVEYVGGGSVAGPAGASATDKPKTPDDETSPEPERSSRKEERGSAGLYKNLAEKGGLMSFADDFLLDGLLKVGGADGSFAKKATSTNSLFSKPGELLDLRSPAPPKTLADFVQKARARLKTGKLNSAATGDSALDNAVDNASAVKRRCLSGTAGCPDIAAAASAAAPDNAAGGTAAADNADDGIVLLDNIAAAHNVAAAVAAPKDNFAAYAAAVDAAAAGAAANDVAAIATHNSAAVEMAYRIANNARVNANFYMEQAEWAAFLGAFTASRARNAADLAVVSVCRGDAQNHANMAAAKADVAAEYSDKATAAYTSARAVMDDTAVLAKLDAASAANAASTVERAGVAAQNAAADMNRAAVSAYTAANAARRAASTRAGHQRGAWWPAAPHWPPHPRHRGHMGPQLAPSWWTARARCPAGGLLAHSASGPAVTSAPVQVPLPLGAGLHQQQRHHACQP